MAAASDDLDAALRLTDPDRWLSSRFIGDETQRADVVAIYAFDQELSQVASTTREALAAEIRLTWWQEALDEIIAGKPPRAHPALASLAAAITRRGLPPALLEAMIEARFQALEADHFADVGALEAYLDAADGSVTMLVVAVLAEGDAIVVKAAARAWGLIRLLRQRDKGGADRLPRDWDAAPVRRAVLALARKEIAELPVAVFPAVAHLALAKPYLSGRNPLGLEKRLRMTWAVATGAV